MMRLTINDIEVCRCLPATCILKLQTAINDINLGLPMSTIGFKALKSLTGVFSYRLNQCYRLLISVSKNKVIKAQVVTHQRYDKLLRKR